MFEKMLVATDLSKASSKMICAVEGLKSVGVKEALLVDCLNIRDVGGLSESLRGAAEEELEAQRKVLENLGFAAKAQLVVGLPQIELARIAEEQCYDFLVVGSKGATLASELLLGGVASAVIHSSRIPVLVLRIEAKQVEEDAACESLMCKPLQHILFPTDFSDNAELAFQYLQELARKGAERITLFHVQDEARIKGRLSDQLDAFNRIDAERFNRMATSLRKSGAKEVIPEIVYGMPKKLVLERANAGDVSMVVMGSQGRGYAGDFFLGSVSHAVSRRIAVPLLLTPMPK